MGELWFRPFDADNHYYEAEDAFTRHIDPARAKQCRASAFHETADPIAPLRLPHQ